MTQSPHRRKLHKESIARDARDDEFQTAIIQQLIEGKPLGWDELAKLWEEATSRYKQNLEER